MMTLFRPAIWAMNRMTFVTKFLLTGTLLLLPFAFVTYLMRKESRQQIAFNEKERHGIAYVAPAIHLLGHFQDCRTYATALLCGEEDFRDPLERAKEATQSVVAVMDALDQASREELRAGDGQLVCAERWQDIRRRWLVIKDRTFATPEEAFEAYTALCAPVIDWILNDVANWSGLTLDPELDSHWLMEALVEKLPQLTEDMSQACARSILFLRGRRSGVHVPPDQEEARLDVHSLHGEALGILEDFVDINLKTVYRVGGSNGRNLQATLDAPTKRAVGATRRYLAAVKAGIIRTTQAAETDPVELIGRCREGLDASRDLSETVRPELDRLILARLESYRKDEVMAVAATVGAACLYAYLFIAFSLAINASVAKIAAFTRRMLEGTRARFHLDSRDELAQVAESFNEINDTLYLTRELKEQLEHRGEELRTSEARFRMLASRAPVGIFLTDPAGGYVYVNDRWCALASMDAESANGEGWVRAIHSDDRDRVRQEWDRAIRGGWEFASEYRFGDESNTVWLSGNAIPLRDRAGNLTGILGSVTDITEQKRVERLKNEFISTVSHELRTPLTSIRGSLGLLAGGVAGDLAPKAKSMIDIAKKNCERLVRLVSDILDIEKIEMGRMRPVIKSVELGPLLEQAVEANRAFMQGLDVGIDLESPPAGLRVMADPDHAMQVLTNLLSNASKFSPKGSSVQVRVSCQGANVRVFVQDQGPGIPVEFRPRIFQKFAQADGSDGRAKQGTGLGLSISKAIVERMGGTMGFESEPGKGCTFFFDLPKETPPAALVTSHQPNRPVILVCEDDPDISSVLAAILDSEGYNVDVAPTASRAKELLAKNRYAGMTLDLALPDQDGISLLREVREDPSTRRLPIIVVSAYMDEGRRAINGDAFGIVDWLEKPIDLAKLREALVRTSACFAVRKPRILHVEDNPDITMIVQAALSERAEVIVAGTLADARRRIRDERFDLLVLDIGLPDGSGLELLPLCRGTSGPATPVVIFSAQEVSSKTARHVQAALLKSRNSHEELVASIQAILENPIYSGAPAAAVFADAR